MSKETNQVSQRGKDEMPDGAQNKNYTVFSQFQTETDDRDH